MLRARMARGRFSLAAKMCGVQFPSGPLMETTQVKFAIELERLIDYFRKEFNLTYYDAIGVLTHTASRLSIEAHEQDKEEDTSG